MNETDNNLKNLYNMILKLNKQVKDLNDGVAINKEDKDNDILINLPEIQHDLPTFVLPANNTNNNNMTFKHSNSQLDELKEEFKDKFDKINYDNKIQDEEIDRIKRYLVTQSQRRPENNNPNNNSGENNNNSGANNNAPVFDFKDFKTVSNEEMDEVKKVLSKVHETEKNLWTTVSEKIGKEELEKSQKMFQLELEKLNQKINRVSKEIGNHQTVLEDERPSENAVTMMGGVEEVKRVMYESVKSHETIIKIEEKNHKFEGEFAKIYESIIDLRKVYTEEINNKRENEFRDLVYKVNDLESDYKLMKTIMDEIRAENQVENEDNLNKKSSSKGETERNQNQQSSAITGASSLKEFVKAINQSVKQLTDKQDRLASRLDSMSNDILDKLKKDLSLESTKILDNFKIELKFSISRIEEQMREKVDRFNMEEFSKKFEQKMLNEMSKKLDRMDLKKNNSIINKKVKYSIEN